MLNVTNNPFEAMLRQGQEHHAHGRLAEAEKLYRQILERQPMHPVALNLLAAIALQSGKPGPAAELAQKAIAILPKYGEAYLHFGIALAALGDNVRAEGAYRTAIELSPERAEGHYNLGLMLAQVGKAEEAAACFRKAISLHSAYVKAYNDLGNALRAMKQLEGAAAEYRRAINIQPNFAEAHYNLGITLADLGKTEEAVAAYLGAIRLRPAFPEALNNMATEMVLQGKVAEAIPVYRRSLAVNPNQVETSFTLGVAHFKLREMKAAAAELRRTVAMAPTHAKAHHALGCVLRELGDVAGATAACGRAADLEPEWVTGVSSYALMLVAAGNKEAAVKVLEAALTRLPENPELRFELDSLTGKGEVTVAPPEYVRSLFDSYSSHFDNHLVQALHYEAPRHLVEAVEEVLPGRKLDVLDLGCGTGLMGAALKGRAKKLVGVDLSLGMLEKARGKGEYTELHGVELLEYLRTVRGEYDLVVAADVFNYVGDLSPVFAEAWRALRVGGLLAFTVEHAEMERFALQATMRFAHGIGYVRRLAGDKGFVERYARQRELRREGEQGVVGWVVVMEKRR